MNKTDDTSPARRSARGFVVSALAMTGIIVGCSESTIAMPDAAGLTDATVHQADAAMMDLGVVDAAGSSADVASVDAAIANADATSVDATAWEDDGGGADAPDTNPYLRG